MQTATKHDNPARHGNHLKSMALLASFGGLFLSILSTGLIWAGTDTFNCSTMIWKATLMLNLFLFALVWFIYLPFRNTNRLLGHGLLSLLMLFTVFLLFGFSGFYFYFLFAPISMWLRLIALISVTTALLYRAYLIVADISEAFLKNKELFGKMYCDEGATFGYGRKAFVFLQKSRRDRNPFKSIHAYAAIIVAPFVLVLNRVLTPVFGDGHGFFMVMAFFCVPMLLWGVEIFVQTAMTMVYYPIKLERETGKPVLLKDW